MTPAEDSQDIQVPVQGQRQLKEAQIWLGLTGSDVVVSREMMEPWEVSPVVQGARFCSSPELWQRRLQVFSIHIATLVSNNHGVPSGKARTHACLLQRQGGTVGFSLWFFLCHGLLSGVASNGKL